MKRLSGMLVLALTLAAGLVFAPSATAATNTENDRNAEDMISILVNAARKDVKAKPLARSAHMDAVAYNWAYRMAKEKKQYHNPKVSDQIPENWNHWGENIGRVQGYPITATPLILHRGWMESPGHRKNLLTPTFTHAGYGVYTDKSGTTWGVQVFGTFDGTPSAKPAAPLAAPGKDSAPTKQKSSISGVKKSTYTVRAGSKTSVKVKVSSNAYLEMKHGKHPWKKTESIRKGTQNVVLPASIHGGKSLYYRISIPKSTKVSGALSPTVTVKAEKQKSSVSGIKTATYTVPTKGKKTVTVKVSSPALLMMKHGSKPWKSVAKVKAGQSKISLPASIKHGKKLHYRVYIPKTSKVTGKWSPTVTIQAKKKTSITGMKGGNNKIKRSKYHVDKIKLSSAGYFQKYSGGKWKTLKKLPAGTNVIKAKANNKKGGRVLYRVLISNSSKKIGAVKRVRIIAY